MAPSPTPRYTVQIEEGSGHGDLYELERSTYYRVVDRRTQQVVLSFEGELFATLSRDTGQWDDYHYSGVSSVTLAPDERTVHVTYYGGRTEDVPLPP